MEIKKTTDQNVLTIALKGRLDSTTALELENAFSGALLGISEIVMDFTELEYVSSAGLRVLLGAKKAIGKAGEMRIVGANETVREVFEVTGFSNILKLADPEELSRVNPYTATRFDMSIVNKRVDGFANAYGISPKERNVLRLLAEEMISMTESLLKNNETTFEVNEKEGFFELHLRAKADVGREEKEAFLEMSTRKENLKTKSLKGKIMSVFEELLYAQSDAPIEVYAIGDPMMGYCAVWSMKNYLDNATPEEQAEYWDGMEKSIIASFADDVSIGVNSGEVEMIVKKAVK